MNTIRNLDQKLVEWDALIKSGEGKLVKSEIAKMVVSNVPNRLIVKFADICRRSESYDKGLFLLQGHLFRKGQFDYSQNNKLISSYCELLLKVNASQYAYKLINNKTLTVDENIAYLRAVLGMVMWDIEGARKNFESYLNFDIQDAYKKTIQLLNYASALAFLGEYEKCHYYLDEVIKVSTTNSWKLLIGNALESKGYVDMEQNELNRASESLEQADIFLEESNPRYKLFVSMWKALIELKKSPTSENAYNNLERIRNSALEIGSWNSVRKIDMYASIFTKDIYKLQYVYAGSPYSQFQYKINSLFGKNVLEDNNYLLKYGNKPRYVLNIKNGTLTFHDNLLIEFTKTMKALLSSLLKDFYRQPLIPQIFCEMYPDEYFNPNSSPRRVYVATQRLRKAFEKNNVPLDIEIKGSKIRLIPKISWEYFSIVLPLTYE